VTPPRDNPFAAARFAPGQLPWIGEIEPLVERACTSSARLQVLGPHGSGKSTLLVHLERRARSRGWSTYAFRGSRGFDALHLAVLPRPLVVFADEFEELGAVRAALLRACCALRGASLVVTAHRDLGMETLCERSVDAATALVLCHRLLAGAEPPTASELDGLLRKHDGNVREVFFDLYDAAGAR
jgi:hypothetical protein